MTQPTIRLKARDAAWTVFVVDPIAGSIVAKLAASRFVTAERLTAASAVLGAASGVAFALGQLILGAALFQLSFLVDCMDGKLAALRGTSNPRGAYFDIAADNVRSVAAPAGLACTLIFADGHPGVTVLLLVVYVAARFSGLLLAQARPLQPVTGGAIVVRATPASILRAAPRRSLKPGTSVDTEALVFTVAPVLGPGLLLPALALASFAEIGLAATFVGREIRAGRRAGGAR